jgi:hypothetical protein
MHSRLPHDSPHPTATHALRPRTHPRPVSRQTPARSPLPQVLDLVARGHSHGHDVLRGLNERDVEQGSQSECDAKCASIATRIATPHASASGSTEPHKTTEPAATIQVAAGSSKLAPGTTTGPRQNAAQKTARRGHGWPGGREVAGTGTEQTRFHSGRQGLESVCDAKCYAFSADRIELLARAVVLVAGMRIPEAALEAVLARVIFLCMIFFAKSTAGNAKGQPAATSARICRRSLMWLFSSNRRRVRSTTSSGRQ